MSVIDEAIDLYRAGESLADIAERLTWSGPRPTAADVSEAIIMRFQIDAMGKRRALDELPDLDRNNREEIEGSKPKAIEVRKTLLKRFDAAVRETKGGAW